MPHSCIRSWSSTRNPVDLGYDVDLSSDIFIFDFTILFYRFTMTILDEYWDMHPEMQDYPIYYASALAKKCMSVFQTYTGAMNDKIKKKLAVHNPFEFKFITFITVRDFTAIGFGQISSFFASPLNNRHCYFRVVTTRNSTRKIRVL